MEAVRLQRSEMLLQVRITSLVCTRAKCKILEIFLKISSFMDAASPLNQVKYYLSAQCDTLFTVMSEVLME